MMKRWQYKETNYCQGWNICLLVAALRSKKKVEGEKIRAQDNSKTLKVPLEGVIGSATATSSTTRWEE